MQTGSTNARTESEQVGPPSHDIQPVISLGGGGHKQLVSYTLNDRTSGFWPWDFWASAKTVLKIVRVLRKMFLEAKKAQEKQPHKWFSLVFYVLVRINKNSLQAGS